MASALASLYSGDRLFGSARGVEAMRAALRRDPPRRILVMAPGALGDAVMTTGGIRSIVARFPSAHITVETDRQSLRLFDNFPGIAAHARSPRFETLASVLWLRRQRFDLGLLLDDSLRRARALRWGGVPRTAGVRERDDEAYLDASVCWDPDGHDRFDPLSAVLTLLEAEVDVRPCIFPSSGDTRSATRAFVSMQPPPQVALFVGASIPQKLWPIERFIDLGHRLEAAGIPVAGLAPLEGGDARAALSAANVRLAPALPHPLVFAEFLRQFRVLVTTDSGPAHLAAAVGVPVVVLYVATRPERSAPYGDAQSLIHGGLDCDVYTRRCAGRSASGVCGRRCQQAIDVDRVFDATMRFMRARTGTVPDTTDRASS